MVFILQVDSLHMFKHVYMRVEHMWDTEKIIYAQINWEKNGPVFE